MYAYVAFPLFICQCFYGTVLCNNNNNLRLLQLQSNRDNYMYRTKKLPHSTALVQ